MSTVASAKRRRPDDDGVGGPAAPPRAAHNPYWHGCRSVTSYRPLRKIDEGTYGVVFAAEDVATGERVALKKVKLGGASGAGGGGEGFPITALRETNVLLSLRHPSIIRVREMVVGADLDKVYMVSRTRRRAQREPPRLRRDASRRNVMRRDATHFFLRVRQVMDYIARDLKAAAALLPQPFTTAEVKCLMAQLLSGVAYMHEHWVVHRDLKTSNLLLGDGGRLAICDFGLARRYGSPARALTAEVVTQWYRAPELLLGARVYGPAIDVWSCGCILAELLLKRPLLPGRTEAEQLELIFRLLGTPTDAAWPGWDRLPLARELRMRPRAPANLRSALGLDAAAPYGAGAAAHVSEAGLDLLRAMLALDPARRISAADARSHPWFAESPLPLDPRLMPSFPDPTDAAAAAKQGGGSSTSGAN